MEKSVRVVFLGYHKSKSLSYEAENIPELKSGQILGKVLMSTICGSDVHTFKGIRNEAIPSVLGHEGVLEVVECKRKCCACNPGDRVTFSIIDCCGQCQRCTEGLPQKCLKLAKYGHLCISEKSGWTGCYASHIILEPNTDIFVIKPEIPLNVIAPINCALATMVNAVSNIPQIANRQALIQGAGLLGVYGSVLLAENVHIEKTYCSDIDDNRLEIVRRFGAIPVKDTSDLADDSLDVVIEVCGHAAVISEGYRCLKPGGLYILVGLVHPDSKMCITAEQIIRKCLTIVGVHNYKPVDLQNAVEFITGVHAKYPFEELVSPPFKLANASEAFELAARHTYHRVAMTHFI